ncbi:ParM/StbA family protein [Mechercharimyces sp. CAU 1602]|uniref:ParM/StbA family protein n=1 Tax=Mechercharimyces sp. CAU 1602 TaxID=2973933 RepID=UPI0021618589|nr:ParM/StbA family protein [Mechercharimyces sp. CAU 1602]MCS1352817.1 ParM/StbA family protein [Mechercharimyces sp. CAU 1602]
MSNWEVVGLDIGRSQPKGVKMSEYGQLETYSFPSWISSYYESQGEDPLKSDDDLVVELLENGENNGPKFFVGEVNEFAAKRGTDYKRLSEEKATKHNLIFALTMLYRMGIKDYQPVVIGTGVPYLKLKEYGPKVKEQFDNKRYKVRFYKQKNQVEARVFDVRFGFVVPEAMGAYYDDPVDDSIGISDLGSVTHNLVYLSKKRVKIDFSTTKFWGCDKLEDNEKSVANNEEIAEMVCTDMKGMDWPSELPIRLAGGKASDLLPFVRKVYPNASVVPDPLFANARGFFKVANLKAKELQLV